jgi:hypothetical protein
VECIRFFKQQQWKVTNYALLIYAAIYFLQKELRSAGKSTLVIIAWLTFFASFAVLTWLERSLGKARARADKINEDYFTDTERRDLNIEGGTRWYAATLLGVICRRLYGIMAGATAVAALLNEGFGIGVL